MAAIDSLHDRTDTGNDPPCPRSEDGSHWHVPAGYWRTKTGENPPLIGKCQSPLLAVCLCGHAEAWRCKNGRASKCEMCADRYKREVRRVAHSGMQHSGRRFFFYFFTLTAPSEKGAHYLAGRPCPCSPPGGVSLAHWNASHSSRWNHFRTVMRDWYPQAEFMRGVEVQKRGALHDHVIVRSPIPLSESALRDLAIRAGFGHNFDFQHLEPGSTKAANYVSKYVTKSTDSRDECPWMEQLVNEETGELREKLVAGKYRTWSSSRAWGLRMVDVRTGLREHMQRQAALRNAIGSGLVPPRQEPPQPARQEVSTYG